MGFQLDMRRQDLRVSVEEAKSTKTKSGTAAIYGAACTIPDRHIVKDLLVVYQDTMLS